MNLILPRASGSYTTLLQSALAADSAVSPLDTLPDWLEAQRGRLALRKERIAFKDLDQWHFQPDPVRLAHRSGKFFEIEGIHVETDLGDRKCWDQPIVNQPEIGILGAVGRRFNGVLHLLMQAKIEPGNINGIQLSPTEQATRSNYTKVHGGQLPPFHAYFTESNRGRVLVDRLLSEHGGRFLRKRNRNVIVEVEDDVEAPDGFRWLTLGQIKHLLTRDDLINMTTRSVISCILPAPWEIQDDPTSMDGEGHATDLTLSMRSEDPAHPTMDLLNWLSSLRSRHHIRTFRRPLDRMDGWVFGADHIHAPDGDHGFSVIAVSVEATGREVRRWTQPLVHHDGIGVNGFLTREINGIPHFLVRAWLPPGGDTSLELGPTVCATNAATLEKEADRRPYLTNFLNPAPNAIRHRSIQSEEGGRFNQFRSHYMILEVQDDAVAREPEDARWMTLGQIAAFTHFGMVNIEARNLLACLDLRADNPQEDPIGRNGATPAHSPQPDP
jgi:oxidase EvaA